MSKTLLYRVLAIASVAGLTACDRPTAPRVRDVVEAQQRALYRGTPRQIDERLALLLERVSVPGWVPRALRGDTAVFEQDGDRFPLNRP